MRGIRNIFYERIPFVETKMKERAARYIRKKEIQ